MDCLKFEQLTEEELESYLAEITNTQGERDIKVALNETLLGIQNEMKKNEDTLSALIDSVVKDKSIITKVSLLNIAKKLNKAATELNKVPFDYGMIDSNEDESLNCPHLPKKVDFMRDNDVLIIKLPELLPHRPQYDTVHKKMRYFYDVYEWKASYMESFSEEFKNGKFHIYDDKVVMIFLHHFDRTVNVVPDIDNLERKAIIDIITCFLLYDDNYKCVCHFEDAVEDDRSYTEIIICPRDKMHDYV